MFVDTGSWPPAPDGVDPPPQPPARLDAGQTRMLMRIIGLLLFALFVGPFAGSSIISAVAALLGKATG